MVRSGSWPTGLAFPYGKRTLDGVADWEKHPSMMYSYSFLRAGGARYPHLPSQSSSTAFQVGEAITQERDWGLGRAVAYSIFSLFAGWVPLKTCAHLE
ncbi:MAG: hypothetical protein DMG06_17340 [Acidobacteria bacterium]|nr:MAG: hypothetical protein DMG06_17340 [Acidobacteriota bacterium]